MPVNKQAAKAIKLAIQLMQNYADNPTTFSTCSGCKSNPARGGMECPECLEDELALMVGHQMAKNFHEEIKYLVKMIPRFLDVEASSLSMNSYPIEIAWSDHQGNIESHLINLYAIEEWTDWDYNAQQMHGLSRKQCKEEGIRPDWLCERMSQSIKPGEMIYADGGPFDQNWIDVLFEAGSTLGYAQFRVIHSDAVMLPILARIDLDEKKRWQLYETLKLDARRIVGTRHRAEPDVQYLIELWKLCLSMSQAI